MGMDGDGTLPAELRSELKAADRAVQQGRWRHDSLARVLGAAGGTQIRFNFSCNPRVPDEAPRTVPEAVRKGMTLQDECVRRVQAMVRLLRAHSPPVHEAWSNACSELLTDMVSLTLLLFGSEGQGTVWHTDWADAINIAFALSKTVSTTMSSACMDADGFDGARCYMPLTCH